MTSTIYGIAITTLKRLALYSACFCLASFVQNPVAEAAPNKTTLIDTAIAQCAFVADNPNPEVQVFQKTGLAQVEFDTDDPCSLFIASCASNVINPEIKIEALSETKFLVVCYGGAVETNP